MPQILIQVAAISISREEKYAQNALCTILPPSQVSRPLHQLLVLVLLHLQLPLSLDGDEQHDVSFRRAGRMSLVLQLSL